MALPGPTELIIIAGVVLLLFGARKLPQLGGAIGESIKNFKKGIKDEGSATDAGKPKLETSETESKS